jgi:ElaB/YqjD/DUF883 family membrane-anchored ribosome-binding protein
MGKNTVLLSLEKKEAEEKFAEAKKKLAEDLEEAEAKLAEAKEKFEAFSKEFTIEDIKKITLCEFRKWRRE